MCARRYLHTHSNIDWKNVKGQNASILDSQVSLLLESYPRNSKVFVISVSVPVLRISVAGILEYFSFWTEVFHQSVERKKHSVGLFNYSADRAETEYPDTESLQLESRKPSVFRPVRAFKMGPVAVQFRVKSEISRIASMKIDHFRTFFRALFLPKMADLRHRKLKSRVATRDFRQLHLNRPHAVGIIVDLDAIRRHSPTFIARFYNI